MILEKIEEKIKGIAEEIGLDMNSFREKRIWKMTQDFSDGVLDKEGLIREVIGELGYKFTRAHEREFRIFLDRLGR